MFSNFILNYINSTEKEREREKNKEIETQKNKQDVHTRDMQELRLSQDLCSLCAYVD
jgi:hypothetical protein